MTRASRDLVDVVAPPPPRELWRWIVYALLLLAIVLLLAVQSSSGSYAAFDSRQFQVDATRDSVVLNFTWVNPERSATTLSSIRSMHDAVSILGVEGLPQRVGAGGSAKLTVRFRIDCDHVIASSRPTLR